MSSPAQKKAARQKEGRLNRRKASNPQHSRCGASTARLKKPNVTKEDKNDQVDCCCWLRRSRRNFGASNNACADFSVERNHHASSLRMRPRSDGGRRPMCGENHDPSYAPCHPQERLLRETGVRRLL